MRTFAIFLVLVSMAHVGMCDEGLEDYMTETQEIYRTSAGSDDALFTNISTSMLGWGIGLAVAIGVLAAVIPQSHGKTSTTPAPTAQ